MTIIQKGISINENIKVVVTQFNEQPLESTQTHPRENHKEPNYGSRMTNRKPSKG